LNEDSLDIVGSKALRPSAMGPLQTQLATELAIATFSSDPLQKIWHILEAYRTLDQERQQEVEPDETERMKWNIRYEITMAFLNMRDIGNDWKRVPQTIIPRSLARALTGSQPSLNCGVAENSRRG
jgi:hypothetical protein